MSYPDPPCQKRSENIQEEVAAEHDLAEPAPAAREGRWSATAYSESGGGVDMRTSGKARWPAGRAAPSALSAPDGREAA